MCMSTVGAVRAGVYALSMQQARTSARGQLGRACVRATLTPPRGTRYLAVQGDLVGAEQTATVLHGDRQDIVWRWDIVGKRWRGCGEQETEQGEVPHRDSCP